MGGGRGGARDPCYLKEVVFKLLSSAAALRLWAFAHPGHPLRTLGDSFDSLRLLSDSYDYLRLLSDSFDSLRLLSDSYDYLVHVGPSPVTSKVVQRTGAMVPRLGGMT